MGARTDQAEQRVNEQRDKITRMLGDLEDRIRADKEEVKGRMSGEASRLTDTVKEMPERIPGSSMISARVHDHPLTSVAGAFTAGIALGMLSEGFGGDESSSSSGGSSGRRDSGRGGGGGSQGGGLMSALANQITAIGMTSVAEPLREEVEKYLKDAVSGFFEGDRGGGQQAQPASGATSQQRMRSQGDPVDPNQGNPGRA